MLTERLEYKTQGGTDVKKYEGSLPMIGVGPIYVVVIMILTVIGISLGCTRILYAQINGALKIAFIVVGVILILFGFILWYCANFKSKIDVGIETDSLVKTGVYAWVRNPIYTAFMFLCTGAILIACNWYLLVLPPLFWLYMTVLMKCTEEKWLTNLYGEEYLEYKKRVNRCIPFKYKKVKNK